MIKQCVYCLADFSPSDYRQKFCSHSHAAIYNNIQRGLKVKENHFCVGCGTELKKHQVKYCSRGCNARTNTKNYINSWLAGESSGADANGVIKSSIRTYLLKEAKSKCTQCGWCEINPKLGYPILTIDHIDGNWKNNAVDNLVVLCYNCHTLTPTFGALNIGNGAGVRGTYDRTHLGS